MKKPSVGFGVKIPLAKPLFDEEMRGAALGALQGERFVLGESVFRFKEEFCYDIIGEHLGYLLAS